MPSRVEVGDPANPDRVISFEYDAAGNRILKSESDDDPEVLSAGAAYERTRRGGEEPGTHHKFRIFAAGKEVAQLVYDEETEVADIHYLHRDHQTSVLFTTNAEGEASELRDFDVFGDPVATPDWTDTTTEAFGGHRLDGDLGLVDAGARLYDATFGVFTSADPLRISGSGSQAFNPYAYANNDPANLIDPTGLQAEDDDEGIVVYVYGCRPDGTGPYCNMQSDYEMSDQYWGWFFQRSFFDQPAPLSDLSHTSPGIVASNGDWSAAPWPWSATHGLIPGPGDGPVAPSGELGSLGDTCSMSGDCFGDFGDDGGPWAGAAAAVGVLVADDVSGIGAVDDILIPVVIAGAVTYDLSYRTFITYTLENPTTHQVYAGRASGFGTPGDIMARRYASHHMRRLGFVIERLDRAVQGAHGWPAIRGREQQLIDSLGGVGNPRVANSIRAVAKLNPLGRAYHATSDLYFGNIAPYTGY